jgi:hypothetical protein
VAVVAVPVAVVAVPVAVVAVPAAVAAECNLKYVSCKGG